MRRPFLGTRLCAHCFLIKAARRRLSALNRGIVQETSPANLPPAAVGLGERLRHTIENNRKRIIKPREKSSAAIITDASLHGWRPIFIPDFVDVKNAWRRVGEEAVSYHAGRGARGALSLIGLFPPSCHPSSTFGWTTLRCKERRIKAAQNQTL
ncbi:putative target of rapamycin (TOR) kinase 1 [Trypanosoma cruzi]|uniref:Putative target of rapamycin (TOR) kinase 1 n=1 Tax=Trypanosoma cruzi TaxID=5693 RepID=A0A2V2XNP5_TRYCR|nr:putative target of rapamycin (TOR) kinase 1 [Trypanosoma cruzi]